MQPPSYAFKDVPPPTRDTLETSSIFHILEDRQNFLDIMAEMVLCCNEVMQRQAARILASPSSSTSTSASSPKKPKIPSKPLSLEYIADRLDVDDPIFGFVIRTNPNISNPTTLMPRLDSGMLQGFITCTTFTNWQVSE